MSSYVYYEGPAFNARCTSNVEFEVQDSNTGEWKKVDDLDLIKSITYDATVVSEERFYSGRNIASSQSQSLAIYKPPLPLVSQAGWSSMMRLLRVIPK